MRTMKSNLVALLLISLFVWTGTYGQEGPYYTVTTWKVVIPENGSNSEFNSLLTEFQQKVSIPNKKVISETVMRHLSGSDSRDLVIISKYANWNDIDAAAALQGELINKAWPTENSRSEFFKKFNKYFLMHSDEIYSGLPAMDKK